MAPMKTRRPFQFSLATLMVAVTGYAVLFGMLRSLGVSSLTFILVTLYFTTVVYSQWAIFGGWDPYAASFMMGGSLFVLAFLVDLQLCPVVLGAAFVVGGFAGIGVAGFTDIWLLLSEIMRGVVPKAWAPDWSLLDPPRNRASSGRDRPGGSARLAVLFMLASVFFLVMLWGRATGQGWITATCVTRWQER
jgi:hypothetical protein